MSPSDEECVRSCLNDHPEAFRPLVQRYQAPLTRYLRGRLGNLDDATEAAQEAFVRAYFALGDLRKPEAFFYWLMGIADRVAKETVRAAKRNRSADWPRSEPAESTGEPATCMEIAVTEAVGKLNDVYREVVLLRYYGGRSCAEISRDLGVPLGTVTKRLSRAYALLRGRLGTNSPNPQNEVPR
jgi:RNA polymerase sigma factor (sigma-70 family)